MQSKDFLFIRACRKEHTERTPIWIMRQAGRYLPEYRAVREKHDFLEMCKTPELASEVTMQPIDIFGFDAAIIFSDILVIPEAMGMSLQMIESRGPVFDEPVRSFDSINKLNGADISSRLTYVFDAIKLTKQRLKGETPLIGFSGAPWTLAAYMVEGHGTKNFEKIKSLIYNTPGDAHRLLDKLANAVSEYLISQIDAGCDAVQIFDTWGGVLSPWDFEDFSLRYIKQIIARIKHKGVPIIVFAKGVNHLGSIADTDCDVIGVDWTYDISKAKDDTGGRKALQGNLDPVVLFSESDKVKFEAGRILDKFGTDPGHIFNLGHGILPETPVENVRALVDFVKQRSAEIRKQN